MPALGVDELKAAVVKAVRKIQVEDVPDPVPGDGEVLVQVKAVGICGSDVHGIAEQGLRRRQPGLIPGHEAAGVVASVGNGDERWHVGDRVCINPQINCGTCETCLRGLPHLCERMRVIGSSMREFRHGAMCEYVAIAGRQLYTLPPEVSFEEGSMLDPVGNAFHVMNRASPTAGDTIVVIGCGTIGLTIIQLARHMGSGRVIGIDVVAGKRALAEQLGADITLDPAATDIEQEILTLTGQRGADIVIEAVGLSATYHLAARIAKRRGTIIALGFADSELSIPSQAFIFRELSLIGSTGFSFEVDTVIEYMRRGAINVKPLITHVFPLDEVQEGFDVAGSPDAKAIKVVLQVGNGE